MAKSFWKLVIPSNQRQTKFENTTHIWKHHLTWQWLMTKSGHPESNQGPSDLCKLYSQMLYQLSYSRPVCHAAGIEAEQGREAIVVRRKRNHHWEGVLAKPGVSKWAGLPPWERKWRSKKNSMYARPTDDDMTGLKKWQRWGSNPRPYGMAPWATALDRSATLSLSCNAGGHVSD